MAQIPKARLVNCPYKPICRDCSIYFSICCTHVWGVIQPCKSMVILSCPQVTSIVALVHYFQQDGAWGDVACRFRSGTWGGCRVGNCLVTVGLALEIPILSTVGTIPDSFPSSGKSLAVIVIAVFLFLFFATWISICLTSVCETTL